MICKHDTLYRQNNEAAGGAGCPMCNAERINPRRVLRVAQTATENSVTYYNDWQTFVRKVDATDTLPMMGDRE